MNRKILFAALMSLAWSIPSLTFAESPPEEVEKEPVEADVELSVSATGAGHYVASLFVQFTDPFIVVTDVKGPALEGTTYHIDLSVTLGVFVVAPEESTFGERFDLGVPEPGNYGVVLSINGEPAAKTGFKVGEDETPNIPASAKLEIAEVDEKLVARVGVEIEPNGDGSIYHIGEWGEPRWSGNIVYLDATSNGPLESFNTEPVQFEYEYCLFEDDDDEGQEEEDEWAGVKFRTLDPIPSWLRPEKPTNVVLRSVEEWSSWLTANIPPNVRGILPDPPVDFEEEMVIVVTLGEVDQGLDVQIEDITTNGQIVSVRYTEFLPGILPEEPEPVRPIHMVATRLLKEPVRFVSEVIAFPSPPPFEGIPVEGDGGIGDGAGPPPIVIDPLPVEPDGGIGDGAGPPEDLERFPVEPDGGIGDGAGPPEELERAAQAWGDVEGPITVVFRIDGVPFARAIWDEEDDHGGGDGNGNRLPARVDLRVSKVGADYVADVEVAITGAPYHTIVDWSRPVLEGNRFVINTEAEEIVFVREPDLPIIEVHSYRLPLETGDGGDGGDGGETGDDDEDDWGDGSVHFRRLDPFSGIEKQTNVVLQDLQDWYDLIGFEPNPLALPPAPPANLDEFTVIGVFSGAKPNGCYAVRINDLVEHEGVLNVIYSERQPHPEELCTEAIVYPSSLIAIEKTDADIDFIETDVWLGDDVEPSKPAERGPLYELEFRINGEVYAKQSFRTNDVIIPPAPEPEYPVTARLAAKVLDSQVNIHATVDLTGADIPLKVFRWGEVVREGTAFFADVFVGETGDEEPGHATIEKVHELHNLRPDAYKFHLTANDVEIAVVKFVVEGPGDDNAVIEPFIRWIDKFLPPETEAGGNLGAPGNDAALREPGGNHDGDAWTDFEEFLLGLNPADPNDLPFVRPEWVRPTDGDDRSGHLAICFRRHRQATDHADFVVEASSNLLKWIADPALFEQVEVQAIDEDVEEVTVCLKEAIADSDYQYLRVVLKEKPAE